MSGKDRAIAGSQPPRKPAAQASGGRGQQKRGGASEPVLHADRRARRQFMMHFHPRNQQNSLIWGEKRSDYTYLF